MYYSRRKELSQNFLHNRTLVHKLVRSSSIGPQDHVIEIGPGKGIITEELARHGCAVTAVEIDERLIPRLRRLFQDNQKVSIIHDDFLRYRLPTAPFKVFANIPFSIEGKIVRTLLDASHPPDDAYLVTRSDFAGRFSSPKPSMITMMYAPWFSFKIVHQFDRQDFTPYARMNAALLHISMKENPEILFSEKSTYQQFIQDVFSDGKQIRHALARYVSRQALDSLANRLHFSPKNTPSHITFAQWVKLYKGILEVFK